MTEIPEHLLNRSKERRVAMGLGDGDTSGYATPVARSTETAADPSGVAKPAITPAAPPAAAPTAAAPPAKPEPPHVAVAKNRKKVPMWAAPVLAVLPLWGFIYYQSLQPPAAGGNDPLALGSSVYAGKGSCAGCHGADGSGGIGAKLNGGEVLKTFENPLAMVHWVAFGTDGGARANGTYGDPDRPGGPHSIYTLPNSMPAQKDKLTPEETAAVVMYVRQTIAGGKPDKGFDVADLPTLGGVVTKVIALGPGGDPKVPGSTKAVAKAKTANAKRRGTGTAGSNTGSAGSSNGAGSTGGTTESRRNGTDSSSGAGPSANSSDG